MLMIFKLKQKSVENCFPTYQPTQTLNFFDRFDSYLLVVLADHIKTVYILNYEVDSLCPLQEKKFYFLFAIAKDP